MPFSVQLQLILQRLGDTAACGVAGLLRGLGSRTDCLRHHGGGSATCSYRHPHITLLGYDGKKPPALETAQARLVRPTTTGGCSGGKPGAYGLTPATWNCVRGRKQHGRTCLSRNWASSHLNRCAYRFHVSLMLGAVEGCGWEMRGPHAWACRNATVARLLSAFASGLWLPEHMESTSRKLPATESWNDVARHRVARYPGQACSAVGEDSWWQELPPLQWGSTFLAGLPSRRPGSTARACQANLRCGGRLAPGGCSGGADM